MRPVLQELREQLVQQVQPVPQEQLVQQVRKEFKELRVTLEQRVQQELPVQQVPQESQFLILQTCQIFHWLQVQVVIQIQETFLLRIQMAITHSTF